MINNLWEESSEQANCNLCASDEPFFMPLKRTDILNLRVQIPYSYVQANGGSLPIGTNVALSIVDEIGTTTLCNYSTANLGKFLLGYANNSTPKKAQYQIWCPIALRDESNLYWSQYYFTANVGQLVKITGGGGLDEVNFIYGYDNLPENVIELKSGVLVVSCIPTFANVTNLLTLDGVSTSLTLLYTTALACSHESYQCFRFKLVASFTTSGETLTLYTKPFRIERCNDSIRIKSTYPTNTYDINDYYHGGSWNVSVIDPNNLILRIPADVMKEANQVTKSYNDKCYNYRSELTKRFRMKSDPMPEWYALEAENIILGRGFTADNVGYNLEGSQIFQNSEVYSAKYENIDVPLSQCKNEKVFVC